MAPRATRRSLFSAGLHLAIVVVVLYGDVLKRILSAATALWVVYGIAALLLVLFVGLRQPGTRGVRRSPTTAVGLLSAMLILLYVAQVLTSWDAPLALGITHLVYMSIPLGFVVVVQRFSPGFDLQTIGRTLLWLMIPLNVVGWIQYWVDPGFLVSTAYSASGGVIVRNLLSEGTFRRYPSLFASADRFSAMGLMQFYFALLLAASTSRWTRRTGLWVAFNLLSAISTLMIAGARSRIVIAALAIGLSIAAAAVKSLRRRAGASGEAASKVVTVVVAATMIVGTAAVAFPSDVLEDSSRFPVVGFIVDSLERGDFGDRVLDAMDLSAIPDGVTLFGEGLGTQGDGGRPGEFGIRSIWLESGLLWGAALLVGFAAIVALLGRVTVTAILEGKPLDAALCAVPTLLLVFALAAGLTSAFELSTGVLLGCIIGTLARDSGAPSMGAMGRRAPGYPPYGPEITV